MRTEIRVLTDKNLFGMAALLTAHQYQTTFFEGESGLPVVENTPNNVDALIIRTVTKINEQSLNHTPLLKIIVSASAGKDHVDEPLLAAYNIHFDNAAGSNAIAVAEYVLTSLIKVISHESIALNSLTVGIVGVGAVGSEVNRILALAGFKTILYDPPRESREPSFVSCTVEELLDADILSFHTPLINKGLNQTYYLFDDIGFWDSSDLSLLAVINAARGGVLNEKKLLHLHKKNSITHLIADVWENEPIYNDSFRKACTIATPHIAGYSLQAKLRASWQCLCSLNSFFGKETIADFDYWFNKLIPKNLPLLEGKEFQKKLSTSFYEVLCEINPIQEYHEKLSFLDELSDYEKSMRFKELRIQQSLRDEYAYIEINEAILQQFPLMRMLQTR